MSRDWLGRASSKWPVLCQIGLNQSVCTSVSVTFAVFYLLMLFQMVSNVRLINGHLTDVYIWGCTLTCLTVTEYTSQWHCPLKTVDRNPSWYIAQRPFVPPVKDCSTPMVHELLLAPDVFHLLLRSFGTNYLTLFDLAETIGTFCTRLKTHLFPVIASCDTIWYDTID